MTKPLYLDDVYLKECEATVSAVNDSKYVILDETIFYPKSGGQSYDIGTITKENDIFNVVYVGKFSGETSHEIDSPGLKVGDKVQCKLNWERRYKLMRSHTAAHTLITILCNKTKALVTGNDLTPERTRFDFNIENFEKESNNYDVYELGDYGDVLYTGARQVRGCLRSHFHGGSNLFHGVSSYRVGYAWSKLKALQRKNLELGSYSNQNGRYLLYNRKKDDSRKDS